MKFYNIALIFVIFALACSLSTTHAQEETGGKRVALRRPAGKSVKTTTTTSAPANDEEAEYGGEENQDQYGDEGEEEGGASSTTTSTEPPKKIGPVIRPFRSNDDFLNSLKRRQMDAKKHRAEKPTPKSRPAPAGDSQEEESEESAPAPGKGFKGGNPALNRRKLTKPGKPEPQAEDAAAEESEQQQKEDSKAKRPLGRLALRKRA